jgi:hypothetical protein
MFIDQLARQRYARVDSHGSLSWRQVVREVLARLPHQHVYLIGWQSFRKDPNQLRQEWNIGLGEQLLDLWCQFEDIRRPRRSRPLSWPVHDAIPLHPSKLLANGIRRESQLGRHVIGRQPAVSQERDDTSSARIE